VSGKTKSLMFDAASLAIQSGGTTVAEIKAHFPGKSKEQVQDALHNAAARKLVKCIRMGSRASIWGPTTMPDTAQLKPRRQPAARIVSNPFEPDGIPSPNAKAGTVHRPLGGW
jgi:hypothetical protein